MLTVFGFSPFPWTPYPKRTRNRATFNLHCLVFRLGCREQGLVPLTDVFRPSYRTLLAHLPFRFFLLLKASHAFMPSSSLESKRLRGHSSPLSALLEDVDDYTSVYPPDLGLPISDPDWCTHRTESSHSKCCSVGPAPGENRRILSL